MKHEDVIALLINLAETKNEGRRVYLAYSDPDYALEPGVVRAHYGVWIKPKLDTSDIGVWWAGAQKFLEAYLDMAMITLNPEKKVIHEEWVVICRPDPATNIYPPLDGERLNVEIRAQRICK